MLNVVGYTKYIVYIYTERERAVVIAMFDCFSLSGMFVFIVLYCVVIIFCILKMFLSLCLFHL